MNKKYLMIGMFCLLSIGLISAGVMLYYGMFSAEFTVVSAIEVSECSDVIPEDVYSGEEIPGSPCTITNNAPSERIITISNDANKNEIEVSYVGELVLTEKSLIDWAYDSSNQKIITYSIVGDTFEFSEVPGYTLVYYPNIGSYDDYTGKVVLAKDINTMNLPDNDDLNGGEDSNYCINGDNYGLNEGQCVGAKLWLVPNGAFINTNVIDWAEASKFYFETELIQYNINGEITLSPKASLTITPVYKLGNINGTYTINTTIA